MNPQTTRTPESRCLRCGHKLEVTAGDRPLPGSIAICLRCGSIMMLDNDLKPRGMTDGEIAEISADPQAMEFLKRVIQTIQMMPKMN